MNRHLAPATYALAAATIACGAANYTLAGLLPALEDNLHLPVGVIGQLGTAFGLASGLGGLAIGVLTARWPRRRVLSIGLALAILGNIAAALAPGYPLLVLARIAAGLGSATAVTAALGQAAELNAPAQRARAMAVTIGGLTLALAFAPLAAAALAADLGPQPVFAGLAVLALLALGITFAVLPGDVAGTRDAGGVGARIRALAQPGVGATLAAKFLAATAAFAVQTYLTVLTIPVKAIIPLAAYGAGAVLGSQLGGQLADRATPRLAAVASITAQAITFAVWPFAGPSATTFAVLAFCAGTAFWATQPALARQVADLARTQVAPALALDSAAVYLGMAAGGALGAIGPAATRAETLPIACALVSAVALAAGVFSGKNSREISVSGRRNDTISDRTTAWVDHALGAPTPSKRPSRRRRSSSSKLPVTTSDGR
ncbi:MFS transporter [Amycolatopsis sp. NEAU-NG30]|uniref:MFS transporter n=1 Tax=Amycolatopsis melonis TaxID=3156488 RepID=A0ABV0LEM8_9PSEU